LTSPTSLVRLSTSVPVGWSGSDPSAIAYFDVRRRATPWNGSPGSCARWLSKTHATSATYSGAYGSTDCFAVNAQRQRRKLSGWSSVRCTAAPFRADQASYWAGWSKVTNSALFAGFDYQTSKHGATMTRTGIVAKRISFCDVRMCELRYRAGPMERHHPRERDTYHATSIHIQVLQVANWSTA
jgi:hypothetical protein